MIKKTKKAANQFSKEFRGHVTTAIVAAFGFLIAFSWRDAISSTLNRFIEKVELPAQLANFYSFLTAIILTLICILGIIIVSRWGARKK